MCATRSTLSGKAKLFSKETEPSFTPTQRERESPLSHILAKCGTVQLCNFCQASGSTLPPCYGFNLIPLFANDI